MQILELRAQGFRRSRVRGFGVQEGCLLRVNGSGLRVSRPYYPTLKPLEKKYAVSSHGALSTLDDLFLFAHPKLERFFVSVPRDL